MITLSLVAVAAWVVAVVVAGALPCVPCEDMVAGLARLEVVAEKGDAVSGEDEDVYDGANEAEADEDRGTCFSEVSCCNVYPGGSGIPNIGGGDNRGKAFSASKSSS